MARRLLIAPNADRTASENDQWAFQREPIYGEVVLDATVDSTWEPAPPEADELEFALPEESLHSFSQRLRGQSYRCGDASIQNLVKSGYLNEAEGRSILQSFGYYINDLPDRASILDIVAFIVWIKLETKDEKAVREIRNLTRALTPAIPGKITHCGFVQLTETPIALYQAHPRIYEICSTLMCPIVQCHEKDFVSVTSINPITAASAGLLISKQLEKETGVRPFVFVMTTNSNAWTWLCEKHFGS